MNASTQAAEVAVDLWQDSAILAIRYISDSLLYPSIARADLEHAGFHISNAILAYVAAKQGKAA